MARIRCDHISDDEDSRYFGVSSYFDVPDDQLKRGKTVLWCLHGGAYLFRGHTSPERDSIAEEGVYYLRDKDDCYVLSAWCTACGRRNVYHPALDLESDEDQVAQVKCEYCNSHLTIALPKVPFTAAAGWLALSVWDDACADTRQLDAFTDCSPDGSAQAFFGPQGFHEGKVVPKSFAQERPTTSLGDKLDALKTLQADYEAKLQNLPVELHADAKRLYERERRKIMGNAAE